MDIATARDMQSYSPVPIEIVCYHCRQAGEKILKGIPAMQGRDVPRTHRLDIVADLLDIPSFTILEDALDELS